MDRYAWLKGLLAAVISGAANAVVLGIVDPTSFPLSDLKKVGAIVVVSGVVAAAAYLKQSPLPTPEQK